MTVTGATPVALTRRSAPASAEALPVCLVRPPMVLAAWAHTMPTSPPVGLAYLAAVARDAGCQVTVVDAIAEDPEHYRPLGDSGLLLRGLEPAAIVASVPAGTQVIGVSCMFSHEWPTLRDLLDDLRAAFPGALLVAGGEHVTALPELCLAESEALDVAVLGEGEETFAELLAAVDEVRAGAALAGTVVRGRAGAVRGEPRRRLRAVDEIPEPDWNLVPLDRYLAHGYGFGVNRGRSLPLVATRGCPYQCTFCSNPAMWTTRWHPRDPVRVVDEIETGLRVHRATNVDLYDLTAIVRRDWILRFCDEIERRGLRFTWQLPSGTRSEALDAEVLGRLAATGCRNLSYAPESGAPEVLESIKKKVDLDHMRSSMRDAVRAGINIKANIMLGFPGETHRHVHQTLRFCVRMALDGLHDMSISPFSPYPGTELFDRLRADGRIGPLDDEYFHSLASYSDLRETASYSEHVSDRALGRYRLAGMALFYAVSYARRPWRLARSLWNVTVADTQDSRLEMALRDLVRRRANARSQRRTALASR